ncbi:MAG: hypothetical protein JNM09_02370 [Blastocatellia bacterium]|nr:hypothetical protein [Blastocatellia bacterium]
MKNGHPSTTNGSSYRHESILSSEVLALFNAPLKPKAESTGADVFLSSPEDFERAAQAAWIVQQTNNSQVIH